MLDAKECSRPKEVTEEEYDDFLDDCYGPFSIGYITFDASRILQGLDPIAYNCGKSDYEDSLDEEDYWECPICGKEFEESEENEAKYCCQEDEIEEEEDIEEDEIE
jgi:hypothetical protein